MDDPEWSVSLSASQATLDAARTALTVIAAVNTLSNLSGKDQQASAAKVLKSKASLPKYLAQALEKIR